MSETDLATTPQSIHQSLGYWASLLARTMEAEFNARLSGHDITRVGWAVLGAIAYDGKTTPSDLASFLKIDRAAISRLLDRLEDQTLITRRQNPGDRRGIRLQVTPKGQNLAAELRQLSNSVNAQFVSALSPDEAEQVIALIQRMLTQGGKPVETL